MDSDLLGYLHDADETFKKAFRLVSSHGELKRIALPILTRLVSFFEALGLRPRDGPLKEELAILQSAAKNSGSINSTTVAFARQTIVHCLEEVHAECF